MRIAIIEGDEDKIKEVSMVELTEPGAEIMLAECKAFLKELEEYYLYGCD